MPSLTFHSSYDVITPAVTSLTLSYPSCVITFEVTNPSSMTSPNPFYDVTYPAMTSPKIVMKAAAGLGLVDFPSVLARMGREVFRGALFHLDAKLRLDACAFLCR